MLYYIILCYVIFFIYVYCICRAGARNFTEDCWFGLCRVAQVKDAVSSAFSRQEKTPISPGRTQDFLISALLNEETGPGWVPRNGSECSAKRCRQAALSSPGQAEGL